MKRAALLVIALIGPAVAAAAQSRLVTQRIAGGHRVCVYEVRHLPGQAWAQETKVGMGERCPLHYREPRAAQRTEIPSDARLEGAQRVGGRTVCVYVRFGRRYSRPAPRSGLCPQVAGASD